MSLLPFLERAIRRESFSAAEAMAVILDGQATTAQIAGFLVALKMKGETAQELIGFARAMRARATPIDAGQTGAPLVDTCGTGGDGLHSFNISTIAAFVVAGAGVRVAKHGNRSISSRCGSADLMEALGVNIMAPPERAAAAIREIGIGFLFAPLIHPAMKHAQPARLELKMRTAFNYLGPLTNPAGATVQLVGAPSAEAAGLIAEALAGLGLERGFVVHASDGMDEITTTGDTLALEISRGGIVRRTLAPADFGVARASLDELRGGDAAANRAIALAVLAGQSGPRRDVVLVNAAAALVAAGRARDFRDGVSLAAASIDSGAARRKVEELVRITTAG